MQISSNVMRRLLLGEQTVSHQHKSFDYNNLYMITYNNNKELVLRFHPGNLIQVLVTICQVEMINADTL